MIYALGFAMGAVGFVMGLVMVVEISFVLYRYRSESRGAQRHIFFSIASTALLLGSILASIAVGAFLVPVKINQIAWIALSMGITVGFISGVMIFALAVGGLLRSPTEKWWDIKLPRETNPQSGAGLDAH